MSNFMSNSDALQVLGTYAEDIKKGKGVIAVRETSPATAAHGVGEYIRYNGTTYKVKSAISIGDSLILNTNIEANGLPNGTTIFTPETVGDPTVAFLNDLGDVDISNPQNGQVPAYNSTTQMWENTTLNLDTDFVITYNATNHTSDKLPSEIKAAENAGKKLFVVTSTGYTIPLVKRETSGTLVRWYFGGIQGSPSPYNVVVYLIEDSGDTWDVEGYNVSELHTGTLSVTNGGTGATTAADARTNLGLGSVATESTVPVSKGGTGATSLTSGAALIGNGTGAVGTRAITDNASSSTEPSGSTNLATMNSLVKGMQNYLNRSTPITGADTSYGSAKARAIYATTTDLIPGSTALTSGAIAIVYE